MAERTCSIDGCDGEAGVPGAARGWCRKHYTRWQRYGDPLATPSVIVRDDEARFWSKVNKDGPVPECSPELGPCWVWTTGLNHDGYGSFSYIRDRRCIRLTAHRWILGHLRGQHLGDGEESCHRCDNPPCVNPSHLYIGTHQDNMADRKARGRDWQLRITHCPKGHPYSGDNLVVLKSGSCKGKRRCRICINEQSRTAGRSKTHCKNGHPLSGDNLMICKNGHRRCRTCDANRVAKANAVRYGREQQGE